MPSAEVTVCAPEVPPVDIGEPTIGVEASGDVAATSDVSLPKEDEKGAPGKWKRRWMSLM